MQGMSGIAIVRAGACALLSTLVAGCVTDERIRCALEEVNAEFRAQYEEILKEKGTRAFTAAPKETFAGIRAALQDLGLRQESVDADLGYLAVAAPAPAPLTLAEWKAVADADLPMMQRLAARCIGLPAYLLSFEPQGLEIVINATVVPAGGRSEVSLTMRMRQVTPPPSGMPRREYAPPTGVRVGLDKIWKKTEEKLGLRARQP